MNPVLSVQLLSVRYGRQPVFHGVTFDLAAGQCLGVIGPNGAGKTTLLRAVVGLLTPFIGDIRINGIEPRRAVSRLRIAYFAGEATLPGFTRVGAWGTLGSAPEGAPDARRLRALSRGTRQLVGLRTVLGRESLALVVLDEPWEALDPDGARWLSATLELKRDRGAAVVLASHRFQDLAGLCDAYLFLLPRESIWLPAHQIAAAGLITPDRLMEAFDQRRGGQPLPRALL
jgi:ABC-type multidrug transport system ATPase subunit